MGQPPAARIAARYRGMLLPVERQAEGQAVDERPAMRVATIGHLARLAQRDGGVMFHEELEGGRQRYFVRDAEGSYEYILEPAASAPADAPPEGGWELRR